MYFCLESIAELGRRRSAAEPFSIARWRRWAFSGSGDDDARSELLSSYCDGNSSRASSANVKREMGRRSLAASRPPELESAAQQLGRRGRSQHKGQVNP